VEPQLLSAATITPEVLVIDDATAAEISRVVLDALDAQARAGLDKSGGALPQGAKKQIDLHDKDKLYTTANPGPGSIEFTVGYAEYSLVRYGGDGLAPATQTSVEATITPLLAANLTTRQP
jgi:hypothetical protein